jgi:hypothetical protein
MGTSSFPKVDDVKFEHMPHPHIEHRKNRTPVKTAEQVKTGGWYSRFNARFGLWTTNVVGSMTCAYAFAALSLISLPSALQSGNVIVIVSWIAQTFFQLVLLSVILFGQGLQAQAGDKRADDTFKDAEAILHECLELQRHLHAQDAVLTSLKAPE